MTYLEQVMLRDMNGAQAEEVMRETMDNLASAMAFLLEVKSGPERYQMSQDIRRYTGAINTLSRWYALNG